MKYEIKDRWDGKILYADEAESFKALIEAAVKAGANLYGANLVRANLYGANLDGANLDGANLVRANLYGANLDGANLVRANLYGANLYGANLDGANLVRANLDGANLVRANLDGVKGIHGFFCFGPGGSRNSYTWSRWEESGYMVHCGCKTLTLKDFAKAVKETHKSNFYAKYYAANIEVMEMIAENSEKDYRAALTARTSEESK